MNVEPSFSDFEEAYKAGKPQVVWSRLVADLETPVSTMLKLADGRPNSFLLESVEGGAVRGRYSLIGLKPDVIWRCFGNKAEINRQARFDNRTFEPCCEPTLDSLRKIKAESEIDMPEGLPPMPALIGYMGYDTVRLAENLPDNNPDELNIPDGIFLRPTIVVVFDNIEDLLTIITPVRPEQGLDARAAYDRARTRISDVAADLSRNLPYRREAAAELGELPEPEGQMEPQTYRDMVEKAKEYIYAGDIFQVVLSQRFTMPFKLPPFSFYRSLRRTNPSPFLFFLDFGEFTIVGSSPEILVRLRDGTVTVRPLAGTRPRGETPALDKENAESLLADPKELAEHLMLLDLGRNDVGRVSQIGTVEVTDQMMVEYYSHVMHIVSSVEGKIKPGCDAMDALMAGFPAGTVSGAPKVRAMEIIDELEPVRRSFYAGCIGYFDASGDMDTCIALRTAMIKDQTLYIQAGAGLVADSDPESENQECRNKAKALVRAAQEAVRFAARG